MSRRSAAVARVVGGAAVITLLIWRLGPEPFVTGLRAVDATSILAAVAIAGVTTCAAAWRWRLIADGLGIRIPLPRAVAAYYRSQFLNATLPGGVVGDAYRAIENGRDSGELGRGMRAVFWERTAGQAVQLLVALAILLAWPSAVGPVAPVLLAVVVVAVTVVVLYRGSAAGSTALPARFLRAARSDLRSAVLAGGRWQRVGAASVVVVAGHLGIFLIAAHRADPAAGPLQVLPAAILVLLAAAVPLNVAGWGPREGVAAWAFGAAGLGADHGVAVATIYGILAIASCLPGAVILVGTWWSRARQARDADLPGDVAPRPAPAGVRTEVGCG